MWCNYEFMLFHMEIKFQIYIYIYIQFSLYLLFSASNLSLACGIRLLEILEYHICKSWPLVKVFFGLSTKL